MPQARTVFCLPVVEYGRPKILILGFLEMLRKGKAILPAIPPLPGTKVIKATKTDLGEIFAPEKNEWLKIGNLLRNQEIQAIIN